MGADLQAIHRAAADQIRANITRDWNVSPFPYSGMPLPLVEVWPGGSEYMNYYGTFGATGTADMMLRVRVYVATSDAETTFIQITDALSMGTGHENSVPDALMADKTLNSTVLTLRVLTGVWNPTDDDLGAVAEIPVEIVLRKSGGSV